MWARVTARTMRRERERHPSQHGIRTAVVQQPRSSRAISARYPRRIRVVSAPYPRRIRVVSGSEPELSQAELVVRSSTESSRWQSQVDRIRSGCCAAAARLRSGCGLAMFRLLRGYGPAMFRLRSGSLSARFRVQCIWPMDCVTAANANGQIVLSRMSLSLVSRQLSQRRGRSAPVVSCRSN